MGFEDTARKAGMDLREASQGDVDAAFAEFQRAVPRRRRARISVVTFSAAAALVVAVAASRSLLPEDSRNLPQAPPPRETASSSATSASPGYGCEHLSVTCYGDRRSSVAMTVPMRWTIPRGLQHALLRRPAHVGPGRDLHASRCTGRRDGLGGHQRRREPTRACSGARRPDSRVLRELARPASVPLFFAGPDRERRRAQGLGRRHGREAWPNHRTGNMHRGHRLLPDHARRRRHGRHLEGPDQPLHGSGPARRRYHGGVVVGPRGRTTSGGRRHFREHPV